MDLMVSSDGRSVITWDLNDMKMFRKSECFDDGRIEELIIIDPESSDCLKSIYCVPLLVTRTSRQIKVIFSVLNPLRSRKSIRIDFLFAFCVQ